MSDHAIFHPSSRSAALHVAWLALHCGVAAVAPAAAVTPPAWQPDRGDGTYRNPVLHADYSDPDAVRVGDDYWLVASSFSHVPGLPLLHSRDLVNWELTGHALPRLVPEEHFRTHRPGEGVWAPAIRYRDGKYWIFYPDPDFGLYLITATDPRGPWTAPVLFAPGKGLIDPCPLWDDDGQLYLIHGWAKSRSGINNVLTLLRLAPDGTRIEEDLGGIIDGHKIPGYTTLEGPKLYRRDGWYYVFAPAGGVKEGWQAVFRSRSLCGPYEVRTVLEQGATPINGPHQGALVDTPAGDWWFLHFQDRDAYGRVVHLQPVAWRDGWPVMGRDADGDGKGEPVLTHAKPALSAAPARVPPTADEFSAPALGPQWQWQANPSADWASLSARPGSLRLVAAPAAVPNLARAPYLLLQKFPAPSFVVTTALALTAATPGTRAGLIVFGDDYAWLVLRRSAQGLELVLSSCLAARSGMAETVVHALPVDGAAIELRVEVTAGARCRFAYRLPGAADGAFTPVGAVFPATVGRWVGAKVGLLADSPAGGAADLADFSWFRVTLHP